MTDFVDLTDVPLIDNHCHAIEAVQPVGVGNWRALFTESPDPGMRATDVAQTAFYLRLTRSLEEFYGVSGEDAVLSARGARTTAQLVTELFGDASIEAVVIDTGYPAPEKAMASAEFVAASGAGYAALLRLEVEFQKLIVECTSYDELIASVRELVADVRGAGFAGFKSIAAYRTGLAIERWSEDDARDAFGQARLEVGITGSVRLGYKPLLDTLDTAIRMSICARRRRSNCAASWRMLHTGRCRSYSCTAAGRISARGPISPPYMATPILTCRTPSPSSRSVR
jgi:hypothetical protein